jgi:lipoate-protein ligase A
VQVLDLTLPTPAENLACDEALLDWCEAEGQREVLRFWESDSHFVVVGYGNRVAEEVDVQACERDGIPILRRCSGGGTVLQGPGCLNYSLVLNFEARPELANITSANCEIMKRNAQAVLTVWSAPISVEGYTDLAIGARKFSGNAQRRKRTQLLFHGTFLLPSFDVEKVGRYLRMPSREPEYRGTRSHTEFLQCLPASAKALKAALRNAWGAAGEFTALPAHAIAQLVATKYSRREWNMKF